MVSLLTWLLTGRLSELRNEISHNLSIRVGMVGKKVVWLIIVKTRAVHRPVYYSIMNSLGQKSLYISRHQIGKSEENTFSGR